MAITIIGAKTAARPRTQRTVGLTRFTVDGFMRSFALDRGTADRGDQGYVWVNGVDAMRPFVAKFYA
jgi:hypothetical protein